MERHAQTHTEQNELVSYYLGAAGVIYGIALGLVAAGVGANFQALSAQVDEEAAITGALYRDMSAYPLPERQVFQHDLRVYVKTVIEQDWPRHRQGPVPQASSDTIRLLNGHFFAFTPPNHRLSLIHEQAIEQFNDLSKARRLRLRGNEANLPPILWWVIILGAALNLMITWFFVTRPVVYHALLTAMLALLPGSLLFLKHWFCRYAT